MVRAAAGSRGEVAGEPADRASFVLTPRPGSGPDRASCSWRTRTSCPPTPPTGRCRRSPASSRTATSGAAAPSTSRTWSPPTPSPRGGWPPPAPRSTARSCTPARPTRRRARSAASAGSSSTAPTSSAPTTCSTKATGTSSSAPAAACSCCRAARRARRSSASSCTARPGHGSVPLRSGNAVLAAARVVEALASHELPVVIDDSSQDLVQPARRGRPRCASVCATRRTARAALAELARRDVQLADMIEPLYGFAFSPTIVHSNSAAVNVFPTRVELSVDCRMLAGHDERRSSRGARRARPGGCRLGARVDQPSSAATPRRTPPRSRRHPHRARAPCARRRARQQPLRRLHRLPLAPRRLPGRCGLQFRAPHRGVYAEVTPRTTTSTSASSCATWLPGALRGAVARELLG